MNQYRFEIPASIVVSVHAATLAEAEKLAERIRADALEAAPDGYAVDLTDGDVPAVLWVNDDGSKPMCIEWPTGTFGPNDEPAEDDVRAENPPAHDDYGIPF